MFLRILLAATFIWSGLGKVLSTFQVQGAEALTLYNLGVIEGPAARSAAPSQVEAPANPPADPPADPQTNPPASQPQDPAPTPPDGAPAGPGPGAQRPAPGGITLVGFQPVPRAPRLASDFAGPVQVSEVYRTALRLASASTPELQADGTTRPALLPAWMGTDPWAKVLAWTAAVSELLGGAFILLGLLTRFWAFLLAGTMGMAIWLTELGTPIVTGVAVLGFLPPGRPTFSEAAWGHLFWQFALLSVCLSLMFSGAGSLSLDRGLFRRRRHDDDDD